MVSNVTSKAGVIFTVVLAVMMLVLFTSVDSVLAAGNSGPQSISDKDAEKIEIAANFDSKKWLELYKSNGWEKSKFSRISRKAQSPRLQDMSEKLRSIHRRLEDQAKGNKLSPYRREILKPFRLSQKVTSISTRGMLLKGAQAVVAGSTTILLNGSNPDTITAGDSLVITIALTGDTAWFDVFWDANGDQVLDAGDFSLFDNTIDEDDAFVIDNGFEDEDTAAGTVQITLYPFGMDDDDFLLVSEADFLITADDGAAADTAALRIEAAASAFTVSGSVGAHEGVLIFAEATTSDSSFDGGPGAFALTISDASGNYTLNLPTESPGFWVIGAVDVFDVTGGLFPDPAGYFELVSGALTGINFNFISGDALLTVSVQDNNGVSLSGVPVYAFQDGFGGEVFDTTNALGLVDFSIVGGDWNVFVEPDWFYPDYLVPFTQWVYVPAGGGALVTMVAFLTDDSIKGTTYLDSVATGGFEVRGTSFLGYTLTTSNVSGSVGDYVLPTSSAADSVMGSTAFEPGFGPNGYCVSVCHLSADQFLAEDHFGIVSDSTGIDLYIFRADGAIDGFVYNQDNGEPIPFAGVDAYGDNGLMVFTGTDENGFYHLPVRNGRYTVGAYAEGFVFDFEDSVLVDFDTIYVDFDLQPFDGGEAGAIRGMVFDNATGAPIQGADVAVFSDFFFDETGTDEAGFYNFDVPGGVYGADASAVGFFADFADSIVVNGDTMWVDFYLDSSGGVLYPDVYSVLDVPNDQGRQVTVTWQMAQLDFADVTNYSLWRLEHKNEDNGVPTFMASIPDVNYFYEYAYDAPTLGDRISATDVWVSTFMVFAHTEFEGVFLPGWAGSGWSVDNLVPSAPGLTGSTSGAGVELSWTEIVEEEAKYYTIYRSVGDGAGLIPLVNVTGTVYLDTDVSLMGAYAYYVTATDFSEQEGEASNTFTLVVTSIDGLSGAIPEVYALEQNYPNPFNPTTRINYQLPASGNVVVEIYNLRGELVNTLVNKEMQAGFHSVEWNGLTSSGNQISSGVYLYRIQAGDFNKVRKMIMLK